MLDKIITYSFYLLFFLTPLFWTSLNYELFEYNKMILTYGFTVIIVGAWLLKMINHRAFVFNRTPLDIPLLLFLGANILSAIFSIDPHTSIWGYYSRSNGGLLSIISYILLYWAFVSNMNKEKVLTTLKYGLAAAFLVSLWGIAEHFGVSPSCVILRGDFNADCWIQRVQERVFATLGQPNWMAAYLAMLIFPALYFFLTATTKKQLVTFYLLLVTLYMAFTFTYSRGPTLGLIGGMLVFVPLHLRKPELKNIIIITIITFILINTLFGSALTSFRLVSKFAPPPRPAISIPAQTGTQLETGGTESGQIRFIVWQGALDIFKHYPILGSGVETFAYSYYQFRPQAHNQTSEWDFLYNKAHNEYLNYLATTGSLGFGAYIIMIITFIIIILRKLRTAPLLLSALLASYISFLIYNFFLFSVVTIATFFYLFPALAFVASELTKPWRIPPILHSTFYILQVIYRKPLYTKIAQGIVILLLFYLLYSIIRIWYADTYFALGQRASEAGTPGKAYNFLSLAVNLNKGEPFYKSELAYAAAAASSALEETDASLSAELADQAVALTENVLQKSPKNTSFWRAAVRTYSELAIIDEKYWDQTLNALDRAIMLAPTDPKLLYNKALVLQALGEKDQAVEILNEALKLKPDYLEAATQLKEATKSDVLK